MAIFDSKPINYRSSVGKAVPKKKVVVKAKKVTVKYKKPSNGIGVGGN